MKNIFEGLGVALVTPFLPNGKIDFEGLEKLLNHVIYNNVNYVVSLGTTGENATLFTDEKLAIFDFTLDIVKHRIPVVAGWGGNNTEALIRGFSQYNFKQFEAILSVSPYYNKPTQQGIYKHYQRLVDNSPTPIILYNVPGRTSSNITADTTTQLANNFDKIIGIKEASGNLVQCMHIINNIKRPNFSLISGDDHLTLPLIALGASGVISVVGNAFPQEFGNMVRAALAGNFEQARKPHFKLLKLIDLLFAEGNPAGIKATLHLLGIGNNIVRAPLEPISTYCYKALAHEIEKIVSVKV